MADFTDLPDRLFKKIISAIINIAEITTEFIHAMLMKIFKMSDDSEGFFYHSGV